MDNPNFYQIRVKGQLDNTLASRFEDLKISNLEEGDAVLSGHIQDQAALQGIINRISNLGLTLISVNNVSERALNRTIGDKIMNKLKSFATEHTFAFAFSVTITFILMLIVSSVLGALWPGEESYGQPGGIVGRLISITILLALLSRLGWLRSAGFTWLGGWQTWLIGLLSLAYSIAVSTYALTGGFDFNNPDTFLTGLITLFILTAALMEEVVFRGLILHAFVRVWGNTNRGLVKSALVSSLLFSSIHILDVLSGRPLPNVLLQSVQAFLLGTFLAALVLSAKSMYPAVFFHGLLNLAGYLSSNGLEPAPSAFLLLSLLILPLAIFGVYLLLTVSQRPSAMKTELGKDFPNP